MRSQTARFLTLGQGPLVLGHRGASADCPENTLLAFREALRQGADGVELDVMRCGSGEVVVVHDDDLGRVSGGRAGSGPVVRLTGLAELRRVDLGRGQILPTLEEVLEELGPAALVNVELKSPEVHGASDYLRLFRDDGLAVATLAVLRRMGRLDPCGAAAYATLVSSFDPMQLLRVQMESGEVLPVAYLFHHEQALPLRQGWLLPLLRPAAVHPEAALVDAVSLRRWHGAGYAVHVWTVDEPHEVAALCALGVDGIITNQPGRVRDLLEAQQRPPSPMA